MAICAGFGLRIGDALDLKWQNLFTEKGAVKNGEECSDYYGAKGQATPYHKSPPVGPEDLGRLLRSDASVRFGDTQRAWAIVRKAAQDMGILRLPESEERVWERMIHVLSGEEPTP